MAERRRSSGKRQAFPAHTRSATSRYAEAVVAAAVAVALSWLLRDALVGTRILLFWVMSVLVAWRGGFGPVVLASTLGVIVWELFVSPLSSRLSEVAPEFFSIAVYLGVSAALGRTVDTLRRARSRVTQATDGMIDAMLVYDANWRLRFLNNAGVTLLHRLVPSGWVVCAYRQRCTWA